MKEGYNYEEWEDEIKETVVGRNKRKVNKIDILLIGLIAILFLVGAGFMVYPDVASYLAGRSHAGLIDQYERDVADLNQAEIDDHFTRAQAYNSSLIGGRISDPFVPGSGVVMPGDYDEILNIHHMMATLTIPAIDVHLPIFHGTSEEVLMRGVGHIPSTPFPIGQLGKHVVLTGHTGLPTSRLFTDLELLSLGDLFFIDVLDARLAYEIDQISIVLPHEVGALVNTPDEDFITLVTCTPYAINSHRLLVRGARITIEEAEEVHIEVLVHTLNWRIITVGITAALFIFSWLVVFVKKRLKRRKRK